MTIQLIIQDKVTLSKKVPFLFQREKLYKPSTMFTYHVQYWILLLTLSLSERLVVNPSVSDAELPHSTAWPSFPPSFSSWSLGLDANVAPLAFPIHEGRGQGVRGTTFIKGRRQAWSSDGAPPLVPGWLRPGEPFPLYNKYPMKINWKN